MSSLFSSLLMIWEFPQTIAAFIIILYHRIKYNDPDKFYIIFYKKLNNIKLNKFVFHHQGTMSSRFCLGEFLFIPNRKISDNSLKHEIGHSKQSLILGPLYLLLVFIPSYINYYRAKKDINIWKNYYDLYPEKWADKIAKINRIKDIKK